MVSSPQTKWSFRYGPTFKEPAEDEVYIWDAFYSGLQECTAVDEVVDWIGDRRLVLLR